MTLMILGLVIFLGLHSLRIFADGWRTAMLARLGEARWKGLYSLLSLIGFALLVYGFGVARQTPQVLWTPPVGMRHLAALLVLVSFIFLAAAYVPRNGIKARLHHPMVIGVKVWALAHLLANGMLHEVVLFASFLVWAVLCFRAARRRDRAAGTAYPAGTTASSTLTPAAAKAATTTSLA